MQTAAKIDWSSSSGSLPWYRFKRPLTSLLSILSFLFKLAESNRHHPPTCVLFFLLSYSSAFSHQWWCSWVSSLFFEFRNHMSFFSNLLTHLLVTTNIFLFSENPHFVKSIIYFFRLIPQVAEKVLPESPVRGEGLRRRPKAYAEGLQEGEVPREGGREG